MSDETRVVEVVEMKDSFKKLFTPDNFQKYILGTKKNGQPRAVYDVVKDYTQPKKKKKKHKKKKHVQPSMYDLYVGIGKKKKKKKKSKHWHI